MFTINYLQFILFWRFFFFHFIYIMDVKNHELMMFETYSNTTQMRILHFDLSSIIITLLFPSRSLLEKFLELLRNYQYWRRRDKIMMMRWSCCSHEIFWTAFETLYIWSSLNHINFSIFFHFYHIRWNFFCIVIYVLSLMVPTKSFAHKPWIKKLNICSASAK